MLQHLGERDLGALGERMVARHHQHEAVLAERIGFEGARIDGGGHDAESATPSAISPTISSLRRSSRSTLTCGCAARNEESASGRNSVSALVLERSRIWPAWPPA